MKIFATVLALFCRPQPEPEIIVEVKPAPEQPFYDPKMIQIIKIAQARLNRRSVTAEMRAGLADSTMDWISALSIEMLIAVSNSTQHRLRQHLKSQRAIRGVLAFDPISVREYREAKKPKITIIDHQGERRGGDGGPKRSLGVMKP